MERETRERERERETRERERERLERERESERLETRERERLEREREREREVSERQRKLLGPMRLFCACCLRFFSSFASVEELWGFALAWLRRPSKGVTPSTDLKNAEFPIGQQYSLLAKHTQFRKHTSPLLHRM